MKKIGKKMSRGSIEMLMLIVVVALGLMLSGGFYYQKKKPTTATSTSSSSYTCCDTGDGDACVLTDTKVTWKGTNAQEEEYALLKSGIALSEGSGHLAPMGTASNGDKVFVNTSDTTANYGSIAGCERGKDLVFGKSSKCVGIPNDEIIYLCKENCDAKVGKGKFDAYFRVKDGAIPDVMKNCDKPTTRGTGGSGGQSIVTEPPTAGKKNLQLKTFKVIENETPAQWLSPYCKPAIYLYPEKETDINVRVSPLGKMTFTIPEYPNGGWNVRAKPDGQIISNGDSYDYLYYEAQIPDSEINKPEEGFVVSMQNVGTLLSDILPKLGLNKKETDQFKEYWVKVLPKSPYYFVGIVSQTNLDTIAPLSISPRAQTVIRVTLYFEALENKIEVKNPVINFIERRGFTVVEWGGIFKKDKKHSFSCFM